MSVFSASWYRVAALKPRLRDHVEVHRHPYGDTLAYVLQDHATGKLHRFNAAAYDIIGRMNGERTLQSIWEATVEILGDDAPTQDEALQALALLHGAGLVRGDVPADTAALFALQQQIYNGPPPPPKPKTRAPAGRSCTSGKSNPSGTS